MRRRNLPYVFLILAAIILTGFGLTTALRHDRAMHAALRDLQAANQADIIFTSDRAALSLVSYFDHPWHSANDRLLAYYLLGRAHSAMGDATPSLRLTMNIPTSSSASLATQNLYAKS